MVYASLQFGSAQVMQYLHLKLVVVWSRDDDYQAWSEYVQQPSVLCKHGNSEQALRATRRLPTWWHDHVQQ